MKNLVILLSLLFLSPKIHAAEIVSGTASWYSAEACKFNKDPKCPTASGDSLYELEKNGTRFAAMWGLPIGSRAKVCNPNNGKCTTVRILDRGPARRLQRVIDLSRNSFAEIADTRKGIASVTVEGEAR